MSEAIDLAAIRQRVEEAKAIRTAAGIEANRLTGSYIHSTIIDGRRPAYAQMVGYEFTYFRWANEKLLALTDTVAALTAENAHLREALTLGLGEQESVIAGLRAENEILRRALIAHRADLHNGSSRPCPTCYQSAHALGIVGRVPNRCALADADAAALPSSRETTDGRTDPS